VWTCPEKVERQIRVDLAPGATEQRRIPSVAPSDPFLSAYPNPFDGGALTTRFDPPAGEHDIDLSLCDLLGRKVVNLTPTIRFGRDGGTSTLKREGIPSGAYPIVLRQGNRQWHELIVLQ
jgi:hypothetical protein